MPWAHRGRHSDRRSAQQPSNRALPGGSRRVGPEAQTQGHLRTITGVRPTFPLATIRRFRRPLIAPHRHPHDDLVRSAGGKTNARRTASATSPNITTAPGDSRESQRSASCRRTGRALCAVYCPSPPSCRDLARERSRFRLSCAHTHHCTTQRALARTSRAIAIDRTDTSRASSCQCPEPNPTTRVLAFTSPRSTPRARAAARPMCRASIRPTRFSWQHPEQPPTQKQWFDPGDPLMTMTSACGGAQSGRRGLRRRGLARRPEAAAMQEHARSTKREEKHDQARGGSRVSLVDRPSVSVGFMRTVIPASCEDHILRQARHCMRHRGTSSG